jgi:hypothetical protein
MSVLAAPWEYTQCAAVMTIDFRRRGVPTP